MSAQTPGRPVSSLMVGAGVGALGLLAWLATESRSPGSMLPHGYCFTWNPALVWTHVVSDTLIGIAYLTIPLTLLHLVRKRTDMPFNWIVVLFATFIVSCGATHWIEVWTVWNPDYWMSGMVKAVTALASLLTAGALIHLVPGVLAIPTVSQLTEAKAALELEVRQRRAVEDELRLERAALERRVQLRTQELEEATAQARAARATAEEASLQKDRFLAKVSHELRTPLQSTLSWSHVLRQPGVDADSAARAADRIIHNVSLQARLIDDLLDISRILSGNLHLDYQQADAVELIERAAGVVRRAAHEKGVAIEVVSHVDRAAQLWTDAARLEQVVWNLLSNAVQASSRGGGVQLSVEIDETLLRLTVRDAGAGIAAADLPHIFEPFRQGVSHGGSHRGLGLGLAIVRHIVTLFEGDISARSGGPGRGAEFVVRLPLRPSEAPAEPAPDAPGTEQASRLAGLKVVYVEDEPDIAESFELMLGAFGVEVETCATFEQAQLRVREGGFDILLTDLDLDAGHTGLELLAVLRQTPHGRGVPALILSAYGTEADRQASLAAGFAQHLVKPLDASRVCEALLAELPRRPA